MAAYGSYSRSNYGAGGDQDAGGGFMGATQGASSQADKSKYADDTLRPVTIKQILDASEDYPGADLKIDGQGITQLTLVGQVRAVQPQATNVTYKIDDGTGFIDVKKWVDAERAAAAADSDSEHFAPDTYVRVFGRLTTFSGRRHIGAHFIRAIDDFNEVNYHLLEATYVHLVTTRGAPGGDGAASGGGGGAQHDGGGDSMFVDGGDGAGGGASRARLVNCSKPAQTMYRFLATTGGGEGVHINDVAAGTRLSTNQVAAAADELLGQGLVYTTIDDETWAVLDY
ncbi:replication factor A protein 2 [Echria macrotheca]|uniref:Replication factor A protein 2 n=1 Tax=Echria macrotheca TaxID=438768 RepID=A0AAJ0FFS1_9PEZI|nr:replication factor A protein 2 [Echria macrotheca]